MTTHLKTLKTIVAMLLQVSTAYAALDWSYGSLSNADNLNRSASSIAFASNGNVFVAGVEESSSGSILIVTKKFSAGGVLLASVTNSYFSPAGSAISDWVKSISLDASGNVYVLGAQYATTARGEDIVLIKYNSSLTFQWKSLIYNTTYPNNNFNDVPAKLVFDNSGNVYVAGTLVNESVPDQTTILVRKYNTSGSVIYTAHVGEPAGNTVGNAGDMCIDGSNNVTVTSRAQSVLFGTHTIMYARVNTIGIMSWQKFKAVPANTEIAGNPEIECTPAGTLYMAASLNRLASPANNFSRHIAVKLNSAGNQLWEVYTPELNQGANSFMLRVDGSENVFTGGDFVAAPGTPFSNYRIYKFNAAGTSQWSYTSPENSAVMRFENYSTSALFVASQIGSAGPVKLRKLNALTGAAIWTEDITSTTPPGYLQSNVTLSAIAVNKLNSEVVFCGNLSGDVALPVSAFEERWHIRKYGATSPRLSAAGNSSVFSGINFTVYPTPANNALYVGDLTPQANSFISIMDISGKEICNYPITSSCLRIETLNLPNGIYFLKVVSSETAVTKRTIVQH